MRLAPLLLALLAFTGCTLIDRRTFAPAPEAKAQVPTPPPPAIIDPRTALVTIEYSVPSPDYGELLNAAVRAAEARDAEVQYDVIAVMQDTTETATGDAAGNRGDAGHHAQPRAGKPHPSGCADRSGAARESGAGLRPLERDDIAAALPSRSSSLFNRVIQTSGGSASSHHAQTTGA